MKIRGDVLNSAYSVLNKIFRKRFGITASWCYFEEDERLKLGKTCNKEWIEFIRSITGLVISIQSPAIIAFRNFNYSSLPYSCIARLKKHYFNNDFKYFVFADCPYEDSFIIRGYKTKSEAKDALKIQKKNDFVSESLIIRI